ncbi:MAG: HNH endonuclease [Clostridia bacterium]|nr:HNH endonuclease [Clostridia bacterium]
MNWMISANGKMYDHATAFQKWGFVDWRQRANYSVGDIVYIYCTKPFKRVMYKTVVEQESMTSQEIVDDSMYWNIKEEYEKALGGKYARLKLIQQVDTEKLELNHLIEYGLKAAPQGPVRLKDELSKYIDIHMNDYAGNGVFPETAIPNNYYEGAVHKVTVNKYERSSIARQRCISYNGTNCFVCGMNFEEKYGAIGKDFIHIHHVVPLNEIGKEYVVDYKNDLIPVCPNCHAMLHRKINGKYLKWDELRDLIENDRDS